jgi:hypothetical protein
LKGLIVDIYRSADMKGDCSNGGTTSKFTKAILVGEGIPEIFDVRDDLPALILVKRELHSERLGARRIYLHAEPLNLHKSGERVMYGGNHIYTSDSRFPNDYPIKVHDRVEA